MKVPFLPRSIVTDLPPNSSKILLHISRSGKLLGTVSNEAPRIGLSPKQWRVGIQPLLELGVINYRVSRGSGFSATMVYEGRRFTWVPSDPDIAVLSGRACKALLVICRMLDNKTRSIRALIRTLGDRLGMCRRSAQLAIKELRVRGLLDSWRTGRSSFYCVNKPLRNPLLPVDRKRLRPFSAHRKRLLVRLLTLLSVHDLSDALRASPVRGENRAPIQRYVIQQDGQKRASAFDRLRSIGLNAANAAHLADIYSEEDVRTLDKVMDGHRVSCPTSFARRVLAKITRLRWKSHAPAAT